MATIRIRPLARNDLLDIWSYRSNISEESADRILEQFEQKFLLLAQTPHLGRSRPELAMAGLLSFPFNHHVIFYLPLPDGIEIIRILHERRDIQALIGEP